MDIHGWLDTLADWPALDPARFNVVDVVLLVVILLYALNGWGRGFIASAVGLVGFLVAGWAAFVFYRPAANWLEDTARVPQAFAWIVAFLLIALAASALFSWVAGALLGPVRAEVRRVGLLRALDSLAGFALGAAVGVVIAAVGATLLALAPVQGSVREAVATSAIARPLTEGLGEYTPLIEPVLSQAIEETRPFMGGPGPAGAPPGLPSLVPHQGTEGATDLRFPSDLALTPDYEAEQRLFALVNEERQRQGLKPLKWDEKLAEAGRRHAEEMFRLSYFAHESPVAGSPAARARAAGARFLVMGENLAYAPTVEVAHNGLMNSPGHRANILSPAFGRLGIGVVRGGIYGRMFAQEFAD